MSDAHPDRPTLYEFTRGGCTMACAVEVDELDVVGVFLHERVQLPVCWVAQALPTIDDLIRPDAVGLDSGGLLRVVTRLWHNALFCMIAVEWAVEPGGDDLPEVKPGADADPLQPLDLSLASWRTSDLERLIDARNDVDRDLDRGTPGRPCEECLQSDQGSTVDGRGFMRCNSCGYPSQ